MGVVAKVVGTGRFTYEVDDNWERPPKDWQHGDVTDVAVDSHSRIYVFNRGEHPVIIYEADGTFVGSWGEGMFTNPHGITVGPDNSVYCVDDGAHVVRKFTADGRLLGTIGSPGVASATGYIRGDYLSFKASGPPFNRPTAVALSPDGDLYVTDGYGNARVHCFSSDLELKFSWGRPGDSPGEFHIPHAIATTPDGRLLVADRENWRIQQFDFSGQYLGEFVNTCRPDGIAIDLDGNVYVCDLGLFVGRYPVTPLPSDEGPPSRMSIFSPQGDLITRWGTGEPCAPGSFFAAHGIAVDRAGDVYVVEIKSAGIASGRIPADCHSIQKFIRIHR
jgi:DNA-binding beta-propeller fold protein YncE